MTNDEIINMVTAAKKGKWIQLRNLSVSDEWKDTADPQWNFMDFEYRVAPEPLELWVNTYSDYYICHPTKELADKNDHCNRLRCVRMREVLDE